MDIPKNVSDFMKKLPPFPPKPVVQTVTLVFTNPKVRTVVYVNSEVLGERVWIGERV